MCAQVRTGVLLLLVASILASCGTPPATVTKAQPTVQLHFGPVYPAADIPDPLIAQTIAGSAPGTSPVAAAEIRGYLVDWVIGGHGGETVWEMAIMKDGSRFRIPFMRPSAAFGHTPPPRLGPEPTAEARVRAAALVSGQKWVDAHQGFFKGVKPLVYNYLVRIHYKSGLTRDVWVDPDVGRFFYKIQLVPVSQ